jgi:hypothetical protein
MSDVLEVLERDRWDAPFTQDEQGRAAAALEAGRVVFLPHLAFAVRRGRASLPAEGRGRCRPQERQPRPRHRATARHRGGGP